MKASKTNILGAKLGGGWGWGTGTHGNVAATSFMIGASREWERKMSVEMSLGGVGRVKEKIKPKELWKSKPSLKVSSRGEDQTTADMGVWVPGFTQERRCAREGKTNKPFRQRWGWGWSKTCGTIFSLVAWESSREGKVILLKVRLQKGDPFPDHLTLPSPPLQFRDRIVRHIVPILGSLRDPTRVQILEFRCRIWDPGM